MPQDCEFSAGDTNLFLSNGFLRSLIGSLCTFCAPLSLSPLHLGELGCNMELDEISFRSKTVGEELFGSLPGVEAKSG